MGMYYRELTLVRGASLSLVTQVARSFQLVDSDPDTYFLSRLQGGGAAEAGGLVAWTAEAKSYAFSQEPRPIFRSFLLALARARPGIEVVTAEQSEGGSDTFAVEGSLLSVSLFGWTAWDIDAGRGVVLRRAHAPDVPVCERCRFVPSLSGEWAVLDGGGCGIEAPSDRGARHIPCGKFWLLHGDDAALRAQRWLVTLPAVEYESAAVYFQPPGGTIHALVAGYPVDRLHDDAPATLFVDMGAALGFAPAHLRR